MAVTAAATATISTVPLTCLLSRLPRGRPLSSHIVTKGRLPHTGHAGQPPHFQNLTIQRRTTF
ncbi:hypothetical protein E2C01_086276 [Portunus trituberculatus]|uniref:Uncharacterized protein n=1 Tax=Portunus trituberculatus TaxID=210409 RepID=A0A5B7J503_PORTR|nr:hypothetical protein [Portunus trituberculatus]